MLDVNNNSFTALPENLGRMRSGKLEAGIWKEDAEELADWEFWRMAVE